MIHENRFDFVKPLAVGDRIRYVARFHCPSANGHVNFQGMKILSFCSEFHETCGMKILTISPTRLEIERTWAAGREGPTADHCAFHLVVEVTELPFAATYGFEGGKSTVSLSRE